MDIYCYTPPEGYPNFGDELNRWMWPQLLPQVKVNAPDTFMLGIGTILNSRIEQTASRYKRVVVFGSGHGYGDPPRAIKDWRIFCVRGPRTAKALGLDMNVAVTDPGALVAKLVSGRGPASSGKIGYMPHFRWGHPTAWSGACKDSEILLIDPRRKIETIIEQMLSVKVLITEAMHGAIVSDCLRIPWVPVVSHPNISVSKWQDWTDSLDLKYSPRTLTSLWTRVPEKRGLRARALRYVFAKSAIKELANIANSTSHYLSSDAVLNSKIARLDDELARLREEYLH